MVVDYERAWVALQAYAASKTQHGREGLLAEMARIAEESRVPSGELARLLRLYGVEVERARSVEADTQDDRADFAGGLVSSPDRVVPDQHGRGGHDGGAHDGADVAEREGAEAVRG